MGLAQKEQLTFKYGGTFSYESSLKRGPMSGNHWDLSISLPISITWQNPTNIEN
jgi:hypothetical protein